MSVKRYGSILHVTVLPVWAWVCHLSAIVYDVHAGRYSRQTVMLSNDGVLDSVSSFYSYYCYVPSLTPSPWPLRVLHLPTRVPDRAQISAAYAQDFDQEGS